MKHTDARGEIEDLLVNEVGAVTRVTFKAGAVRGNHFHNQTTQSDTVISGTLLCCWQAERDFCCFPNERVLGAGDAISHKPGVAHAYKAMTDAVIWSVCIGPRKGEDYASDTFKLKEPLL